MRKPQLVLCKFARHIVMTNFIPEESVRTMQGCVILGNKFKSLVWRDYVYQAYVGVDILPIEEGMRLVPTIGMVHNSGIYANCPFTIRAAGTPTVRPSLCCLCLEGIVMKDSQSRAECEDNSGWGSLVGVPTIEFTNYGVV